MSLISEQTYRTLTGDLRSSVGDVTLALNVAQGLVETRLGRGLSAGSHTETLTVYQDSTVYPSVTPLTAGQDGYVDSVTLRLGTNSSWPADGWPAYGSERRATVTYTGGYADDTAPQDLAMAICLVAKNYMTPSGSSAVAGAKSISTGDVSITYADTADGNSNWPAGAWSLAKRYQRRVVART